MKPRKKREKGKKAKKLGRISSAPGFSILDVLIKTLIKTITRYLVHGEKLKRPKALKTPQAPRKVIHSLNANNLHHHVAGGDETLPFGEKKDVNQLPLFGPII